MDSARPMQVTVSVNGEEHTHDVEPRVDTWEDYAPVRGD
jgi:hypothetical protein